MMCGYMCIYRSDRYTYKLNMDEDSDYFGSQGGTILSEYKYKTHEMIALYNGKGLY